MASDCADVPLNASYDCANPWGLNCTSNAGFQFTSLWHYTQNIQAACANDGRLYLADNTFATAEDASLTQEACTFIAGPGWTYYTTPDIWNRLTTWKFPLLQLIASFPRPPLSFTVECFVILHLLGDPVDTMENLLTKMSACDLMANHWKVVCNKHPEQRFEGEIDKDRNWKALAIITDAYGEWGESGSAKTALHNALNGFSNANDDVRGKKELMTAVRQTGRALAADRSTKFLPIIVAQTFFIAAIGIAMFRTKSAAGHSSLSDTVFINIEAHSVAFSSLYFWIIPVVFLSAVIGVSQTEAAIPRILRRFQVDLNRLDFPVKIQMPNHCLEKEERRILLGGIYSWQPSKRHVASFLLPYLARPARTQVMSDSLYEPLPGENVPVLSPAQAEPTIVTMVRKSWSNQLISYSSLLLGLVTALLISGFVPPDVVNCRHIGLVSICMAWILSAQADRLIHYCYPVNSGRTNTLFWTTGAKDLLATVATMGGIVITQIGVFNRCACYTNWGRTGLMLPERPDVAATLFRRLNTLYPAFTFSSIGIELVLIPLFICYQNRDALRVFTQRDDRKSNAAWFWRASGKVAAAKTKIHSKPISYVSSFTVYTMMDKLTSETLTANKVGRPSNSGPLRSRTSRLEQGVMDESNEMMPPLTQTISEEPVELEIERDQQDSTTAILTKTQSESSGVDPPSRSGTFGPASNVDASIQSRSGPQVRNTHRQV